VGSGGDYTEANTKQTYSLCVPQAQYTFVISDTYGDGMCCSYGDGSYKVEYKEEIYEGTEFGSEESHTFGSCDALQSSAPVEPTSAPVEPTSAPVEPTLAPVEPTSAPVEPTLAPVEPTSVPVEPTSAPVEPTTAPVEATSAPVETTLAPLEPTSAPVEPTLAPVEPTSAPVEATSAPVEPTLAPLEPTSVPVEPTSAPVEPTSPPVEATSAPIEPTFAPVEPTSAPVEATSAPIELTSAPVEATLAPVEPTSSPVEPTSAPISDDVLIYGSAFDNDSDGFMNSNKYKRNGGFEGGGALRIKKKQKVKRWVGNVNAYTRIKIEFMFKASKKVVNGNGFKVIVRFNSSADSIVWQKQFGVENNNNTFSELRKWYDESIYVEKPDNGRKIFIQFAGSENNNRKGAYFVDKVMVSGL